jgi:hypothetical protein
MATAKSNVIPFPAPGARRARQTETTALPPAAVASPALLILAARWQRVERELERIATSHDRREA